MRRRAFTITEMLVATALIMFIMVILSEAFVAAIDSFRTLKSIGDMDTRMRTVANLLRRELRTAHFSDATVSVSGYQPPTGAPGSSSTFPGPYGFFSIYQMYAT